MVPLGYTEDFGVLDAFKADCFMIISETYDKELEKKAKKKPGKK